MAYLANMPHYFEANSFQLPVALFGGFFVFCKLGVVK
jgi:hypothetical protein